MILCVLLAAGRCLRPTAWPGIKPGALRHFAFHQHAIGPTLSMSLTEPMSAFVYDQERGELREMQTVDAARELYRKEFLLRCRLRLPESFCDGFGPRHMTASLFFSIDQTSGKLNLVEHTLTQGKVPRNFAMKPQAVGCSPPIRIPIRS